MSKEAMKLALEALDHNLLFTSLMPGYDGRIIEKAYKAINKALAEQQTDWEAVAADQAMTIALLKAEQPAQQQEPVVWNVIDPFGKIVATEKDAIRGWARIQGYKPTVESLLGFQEQGWRVVPASPPPAQQEPLTDDEIAKEVEAELTHYWNGEYVDTTGARDQLTAFARAIEAKLKEKNT